MKRDQQAPPVILPGWRPHVSPSSALKPTVDSSLALVLIMNYDCNFLIPPSNRRSPTATGTSCSPLWRSTTKWGAARSPPAWRTLGTLSPWCSWTARPRPTSSTGSRAAATGRAPAAASLWTGLRRWSAAACAGGPRSSKSKSPTWRM